jgi:hypothetical protein
MGSGKEPTRVLVVLRGTPLADVVEMHRELRRVEWPILTQVLAGCDDLVPRFHPSHETTSPANDRGVKHMTHI